VIAVLREPNGRGGSRRLHDDLQPGTLLRISPPRNHFPLEEAAPHSVLIAGGIGITPLRSMILRLEALQRPWQLHYCARSRASAAFVAELAALAPQRVRFHFDDEQGGALPDLAGMIKSGGPGVHVYCCGPTPMLDAFVRTTAALPPEHVHLEYFSAKASAASEGGFEVELARSGLRLRIAAGQSILDAVLNAGIEVAHACAEGVCGSCETRVISGTPDHRDAVLSAHEQAANDRMMICCSGAKSAGLVLDL
jgi:vanillate O-demethylase ferredoxin subunit